VANQYYDNSDTNQRFQQGTTVRADEVDGKLDQVATGFDSVEIDTSRALKFPSESGVSQEFEATALERRRKVLGFDADGNLTLTAGFTYRGDWTANTNYLRNDVVRNATNKNLYVVDDAFTSGTAFATTNLSLAINVEDVEAAKAAAQTAASNASTSETNAATSETNAGTSETNAAGSASAASTSETNAATSETNAGTSETNAGNSATAASTSETNALSYRNKAQDWAENPEGTAVEVGKFSSLHHAAKAGQSATNASNSASAASTSETNAAGSASAASTSESNAAGSASAASTSESNAATSASNASTSETNAAGSASAASTSETNAANTLTTFQRQYHGALSSAPTSYVDTGDLYFDTVENGMRVYSGTQWVSVPAALATSTTAGVVEKATTSEAIDGAENTFPDSKAVHSIVDSKPNPVLMSLLFS